MMEFLRTFTAVFLAVCSAIFVGKMLQNMLGFMLWILGLFFVFFVFNLMF